MMKKIIILITLTLLLLTSCGFGEYTVTYVVDGTAVTETYQRGTAPHLPESPVRDGYAFAGWAFDEQGRRLYTGGTPLDSNVTLYPTWTLDAVGLINEINSSTIEMCVHVTAKSYNTHFGMVTASDTSQGSGVICAEETGAYYCLTNFHVIDLADGFSHSAYTVTDCYGNEFPAELIASDESCDLALLRFSKGAKLLCVATLAEASPEVSDAVIALGSPEGLRNSVTIGKMLRLDAVSGKGSADGTMVDFPVYWHDAPMAHGSSGGALLNTELELVGVNFAIATNGEDGEYLYGFTIPVDRVASFLEANLPK